MDDNEEEPSGALYQLGADGCVRRDPGYVVTNGPAESPDGRTLYHTDTLAGDHLRLRSRARRRAFEQARVRAHRRRRRLSRRPHRRRRRLRLDRRCSAAGACSAIRRRASCSTTLRLPCSAVTKAAFGGDDLKTLYITTAQVALSAEERTQQPLAGGLFRARIDVPGLPQGIVSHGI